MNPKKIAIVLFTILFSFLISACISYKNSNFNRQHYLDLSIKKSNLISDSTSTKHLYDEEISCANISAKNINPAEGIAKNNLGEIDKTDSISDNEVAIKESSYLDNPNFNDTLFFLSGLKKTVEISSWSERKVTYKYMVRDNIKERSLRKKALTCFVVYDSINQFVYAEGDCFVPKNKRPDATDEKKNSLSYKEKMGLGITLTFLILISLPILLILWIFYTW